MGKISRIQLRGISRTPSDRLTTDGGCDESLNIHLDNTESAPVLKPEDVTAKLGLPGDLQADKVFVHKTANYEHIVLQEEEELVAYINGRKQVILSEERLKVNDIASVGNTLIVTTDSNMYYVLYNDRKYKVLGNKVYFPNINFEAEAVDEAYSVFDTKNTLDTAWFEKMPTEDVWNEKYNEEESPRGNPATAAINAMLEEFWPEIEAKRKELLEKHGWLCGTVFVRYAVELYDGTKYSSMPILVSPKSIFPISTQLTIEGSYRKNSQNEETTSSVTNYIRSELSLYTIKAKMDEVSEELLAWKDIVKSVNLYISFPTVDTYKKDVSRLYNREEVRTGDDSSWEIKYTANLFLGSKQDEEDVDNTLLRQSSQTYLVCEMDVDTSLNTSGIGGDSTMGIQTTIADLINGTTLKLSKLSEIQTYTFLNNDDMKHYTVFAKRLGAYNNRTILTQPSQVIAYDYNALNAYYKGLQEDDMQTLNVWYQLDITYLIKGVEKDYVVKAGPFIYKHDEFGDGATIEDVYPFQTFPDKRAYKMIVKRSLYQDEFEDGVKSVKYGEFEMKEHPYLDCAYYYGGLDVPLHSMCTLEEAASYAVNNVEEVGNKIYVSSFENPFYFPIEGRFTFQSSIVGIAVVSAALSQGQFGQFPLYVFTEDGIWTMETNSVGSFVTSKPLSRDVCVNPASITSLDNAVVFVTDKGVMMLTGSQVKNISPNMNGRHYTLDGDARVIIENYPEYSKFMPAITDNTAFMAFMKKASIAYDYAGQRLICIAPEEKYQYVYKIDTDTWHKVSHGINLQEVINSFPECLIHAKSRNRVSFYIDDAEAYDERTYSILAKLAKKYKLPLTDEELRKAFFGADSIVIDIDAFHIGRIDDFITDAAAEAQVSATYDELPITSEIYDFSTMLDIQNEQDTERGIIVTRPFNLGEPDVKKVIQDVRIRGSFERGKVQYILLGSDDGIRYFRTRLRQKSWKLFRIVIAANLAPTERISWIDVMFETKYTTKLR